MANGGPPNTQIKKRSKKGSTGDPGQRGGQSSAAALERFLASLGPAVDPATRGQAPAVVRAPAVNPALRGMGATGPTLDPGQRGGVSSPMAAARNQGFGLDPGQRGGVSSPAAARRAAIANLAANSSQLDPGQRGRRTEIGNLAASSRGALMDAGQRDLSLRADRVIASPGDMAGSIGGPGGRGGPTRDEVLAWLGTENAQNLLGINGAPAPAGPAPAPAGPAPAPAGPAPAPAGPAPAPAGPAPAPAGPAPAPAGPAPAPAGPAPAPAGPEPDLGINPPAPEPAFEYVPPGGGPAAQETIATGAANQVGIVEQALEERGNAIADMVRSGMIDIGTAHDLYDRQRSEIYADFQAEQDRILAGSAAERYAGQLERDRDRSALLAELRAAGVDPALVGDEFAMMDEMYRGAGQEQSDYLDAMGRIGRMSDADRGMMGEGIFGGYRQDLRSRGRELGLGAEFEATEGRQLARERSLQAADLAPYLGVDPRAIASGLYSGVDIPGMTEAGRGREWQTGERLGGQDWQTGERLGGQDWRTGERLGGQGFQAGESALDRGFRAGESALDRGLSREDMAQRVSEAAINRQFQSGESALDRGFRSGESALDRGFRAGESALDRAIRESQLEESIRQFGVGQDWQERQFGELSAAQLAQQAQDQARIDEQTRQFGVGQDWQERQFGELSEAQQQDLAIQQLGAGIDPATGQYLGFDANDPYAAFSPQQRYQAMQESQMPLVGVLADVASDPALGGPEIQQKVADLMGKLQMAAQGAAVTDDMLISGLAADPQLQALIPMLLQRQQEDWRTGAYGGGAGAAMGPSAGGPLGPAPSGSSGPVDSNAGGGWFDPEGRATEMGAQGPWGNYLRDPADWVTPSDILRQNRAWGVEGSPMDRIIDPFASVIGRVAGAVDPMENISRLRRLGGWFVGK